MKIILLTYLSLFLGAITANAQILEKVKEKAKARKDQKTEQVIDKGLNKLEEGIDNIFKKKDKKTEETQPANKNNTPSSTNSTVGKGDPDYSTYSGSTFIPGKNLLFFEDFSTARLGTGTQNWGLYEYDPTDDFERPQVKSIPASSGNWLKMPRKGFVFPNGFSSLPEEFTLEFDLYADPNTMSEMEGGFRTNFTIFDDRNEYSIHWASKPAVEIDVHPHGETKFVYIAAHNEYNSGDTGKLKLFENTFKSDWKIGEVNRVSILRSGKLVKLYLNGKEMFNLPNALPKPGKYNLVFSTNMWGDGLYVSNISIAGNVPNAALDIKNEGKFVTNHIFFDVNSDRIKPESWATLNAVAQAIKSSTGNILIVGHTDSDGADASNLVLSKNRAESVKNALIKHFGIPATRLTSDGKGESEPLTKNTTASEKAQNRRVEFILQK